MAALPLLTSPVALPVAAALVLGVGAARARRALRGWYPERDDAPPPGEEPEPTHDPERPTVAVLLNHGGTQVSDFLLPYQVLAASEALNVHAVAPDHRLVTLTGGLDLLPDLSHAGFARLPVARADLVVVPDMPRPDRRVIDWIRSQAEAGATVLSICTGAGVVAETGLLDGRPATAHWGDLGRFERRYPQVRWRRGVRYLDDGEIAASAGITSGIDATLHMIRRFAGDKAMRRAAEAVGYSDLRYVDDPTAIQHRVQPADLIVGLTAAYGPRPRVGVLLRDGTDEIAVAAAMDTYAGTFSARLLTASVDGRPVRSRHGLRLLPRHRAADLPARRVLVPAAEDEPDPSALPVGTEPVALPEEGPPYAAIGAALDDLAAHGGRPIARFAAKRLEYRAEPSSHLGGRDHG